MFEDFNNFIKDKMNDMKIKSFENLLPGNDPNDNTFDENFYDWSKISATYKDPGGWYSK